MTPSHNPAFFKSAHVRATIVKVLLVVGAIVTAVSLVAEAISLAVPRLTEDQELGDNPMGAAIAILVLLLAVLELLIYVTTVVFFCVWLYRAYDNLRAFNAWSRLDASPGWAVGSFFVPFANLIIPYRAVKEAWQKSGSPSEALLSQPSAPAYFPVWWTFWLLAGFAGNISIRLSFRDNVSEDTATIVSVVASALFVIAAVFAYLVVDAIDKRQESTSAELKLGNFSVPAPPPFNPSM